MPNAAELPARELVVEEKDDNVESASTRTTLGRLHEVTYFSSRSTVTKDN